MPNKEVLEKVKDAIATRNTEFVEKLRVVFGTQEFGANDIVSRPELFAYCNAFNTPLKTHQQTLISVGRYLEKIEGTISGDFILIEYRKHCNKRKYAVAMIDPMKTFNAIMRGANPESQ